MSKDFDKRYETDDARCPYCGAWENNFNETTKQVDEGWTWVDLKCGKCGGEWGEEHMLIWRTKEVASRGKAVLPMGRLIGTERYDELIQLIVGISSGDKDAMTKAREIALNEYTGNKEGG